jgi:hypothetical protein
VSGGLPWVAHLQLFLYCASSALLGLSLYVCYRSLVLASLVELALLAYPGPVQVAHEIQSDSISSSLIMLWIAALLVFARRRRFAGLVILSAITAAAISVRPVNVALVPAAILLVLVCGRLVTQPRWLQGVTLGVGVAVGFGITPLLHLAMYGHANTSSPFAIGVLQKVMFVPPPSGAAGEACGAAFIDPLLGPVDRYLATAPRPTRSILELRYSGYLRFNVIVPTLAQKFGDLSSSKIDRAVLCYAVERFNQSPLPVMARVLGEYWKLLKNWTYVSEGDRQQYYQFVADDPPVLPETVAKPQQEIEMRRRAIAELGSTAGVTDVQSFVSNAIEGRNASGFEAPPARPRVAAIALAAFQVLAAGVSLIGIGALGASSFGLGRDDSSWRVIGIMGVAAQGMLIITAIVEIALPRYVFPIWPLFCAMLALAACDLFTRRKVTRRNLIFAGGRLRGRAAGPRVGPGRMR